MQAGGRLGVNARAVLAETGCSGEKVKKGAGEGSVAGAGSRDPSLTHRPLVTHITRQRPLAVRLVSATGTGVKPTQQRGMKGLEPQDVGMVRSARICNIWGQL